MVDITLANQILLRPDLYMGLPTMFDQGLDNLVCWESEILTFEKRGGSKIGYDYNVTVSRMLVPEQTCWETWPFRGRVF